MVWYNHVYNTYICVQTWGELQLWIGTFVLQSAYNRVTGVKTEADGYEVTNLLRSVKNFVYDYTRWVILKMFYFIGVTCQRCVIKEVYSQQCGSGGLLRSSKIAVKEE